MNPRDISTSNDPVMRGSLAALHRAAEMARQTAIQTNTYLVVVENGQLLKIPPEQLRKEAVEKAASNQAQATDEQEQ
jgi:mRNA degradation ribonuclease J1/J2